MATAPPQDEPENVAPQSDSAMTKAASKLASASLAATAFASSLYSGLQSADPVQVMLFIVLLLALAAAIWYIIFKVNQSLFKIPPS